MLGMPQGRGIFPAQKMEDSPDSGPGHVIRGCMRLARRRWESSVVSDRTLLRQMRIGAPRYLATVRLITVVGHAAVPHPEEHRVDRRIVRASTMEGVVDHL